MEWTSSEENQEEENIELDKKGFQFYGVFSVAVPTLRNLLPSFVRSAFLNQTIICSSLRALQGLTSGLTCTYLPNLRLACLLQLIMKVASISLAKTLIDNLCIIS